MKRSFSRDEGPARTVAAAGATAVGALQTASIRAQRMTGGIVTAEQIEREQGQDRVEDAVEQIGAQPADAWVPAAAVDGRQLGDVGHTSAPAVFVSRAGPGSFAVARTLGVQFDESAPSAPQRSTSATARL